MGGATGWSYKKNEEDARRGQNSGRSLLLLPLPTSMRTEAADARSLSDSDCLASPRQPFSLPVVAAEHRLIVTAAAAGGQLAPVTLTQLIVWDAVSDRDWIYHNYLPRYSMILNDSIIHARKNAIQIFGELARMFGEKFTEMFLVPHLVALCDDPNWAVRKAVCEVFVSVAEHTSYEVRSNVLARNFVHLIHDPCRWVTFGSFQQLGPLIATFANPTVTGLEIRDGKICLCNGEASSAGPTASIPSVASSPGAKRLHAANLSEQFSPQALIKRYGQLPEGIHVPTSMDETLPPQEVAPISPVAQQQLHQARRGERVMDSVLSGLNKMLNTWEKASPKRSPLSLFSTDRSLSDSPKIQSNAAPFDLPSPNHSIAAKCSSTDDLSKLGLEVGPEKKANDELSDDEDDGADLDVSFFEAEPSATDDETQGSKASSEEENAPKNPLSYWSADCDIDFDDEEELRPFGTSTTSPSAGIYLEDRFDVIRQPRSRSSSFGAMGSPNKISPRRHTNSVGASMKFGLTSPKTSSSSSSLSPPYNLQSLPPLQGRPPTSANSTPKRTRKRSESDMDVDDEAPLDNTLDVLLGSGMDGISTPVQVPHELVDCFMSILAPPSDNNYETEVYRYCAHNFPAVAFTLGRDAWPQLKKVYENLAFDDEIRVRSSIAHSIHEIAFIVGSEIADRDLLPVFCTLRSDDSLDVRTGILRHLYDFVKCLSPEKRNEIIQMLPQFFPIGTQRVQHGDWRSRHELISQLTQLCSLYDVKQINNHMSGIALTLANDRVAEVRMEAVMLVSRIVGALIEHEWNTATSNGDFDRSKAPLSVWFVEDIVSSFAETQKWTRRQTFASICAQVIKEKMCNVHQFQVFFLKHLERLINDKVPNVRLAVCEALACWKRCLETANSSDVTAETIQNLKLDVASNLETFANDNDIDVTYLAQRCEGIVKSSEPMNIVVRTKKMHQREEQHFGNRYVFNETGTYAVQRDGATVDVSPTEPPKEPPPSPSLAVAVVSKALPTLPPPHFRPEPPTDIQESVAAAREEATVIPPLTGANPPPTNHPEENVVIDMEIVENPHLGPISSE
ncbi:unnamed protein product [Caenorhabditis auriculariae]|uniref:Serine/threonine-protein phosphatase 4 regulatory subunit 1 n=1 Tax=Caenorhabditis auriculariae TaxID=2777116 RepID=A0A8S1H2S8_9PELO|nr:unnamed protein product [Caenorhabditis auriculariae]